MMGKNIISVLNGGLLAAGMLLMGACEKVVHIDLNSAGKKYVIEAVVAKKQLTGNNYKDTAYVRVSQTKDYDDANGFVGVAGATVTISDNGGPAQSLTETATGNFNSTGIVCEIGHTYTLTVNIGGETFTATSTVPQPVPFTSLGQDRQDFGGESRVVAVINFTDPVGKGNNYRFIQYRKINSGTPTGYVAAQPIFVLNDDLSDGLKIEQHLNPYSSNRDSDILKSGDSLKVEMLCLDAGVYKYWLGLSLGATGDGLGGIPGNPVSNIKGGALGYFSAHTIQSRARKVN